jgi:hypothetical protein
MGFFEFFTKKFKKIGGTGQRHKRYAPSVELLDHRITPATFYWVGASGSDWSNPLNWRTRVGGFGGPLAVPAQAPGGGDNVRISTSIPLLTAAPSTSCGAPAAV